MRRILSLFTALVLAGTAMAEDLSALVWVTNDTDPPIGAPEAKKGGTFETYTDAYPLTFRLVGPNSNDSFASFNRAFTQEFTLVRRHPVTDNFIPWMATHWSIQPDNKTVYYKLDPDAKWSDGKPVTADDYVFSLEVMRSEHINDPYYNQYSRDYFEEAVAVDEHTLKIVGKNPSWRPLSDYTLWPSPRHAENMKLDENWAKSEKVNLSPQVTVGPYTITEQVTGQKVVFERTKNWWGENKRYMSGQFNPDKIVLKVVSEEDRAFDFFKKGDLSYYTVNTARRWAEEMEFDAIKKGWAHRKRLFVERPQGMYGFAMNLEFPLFQNKDFRKALQYFFDFDTLNERIMNKAYYRVNSAFEGTEFANPNVKAYPFDPKKGVEHLKKAGFTKRGKDGIFVNDKGERASFTLIYGSKGLERHLTVVKETYKKFGVEVLLQNLEPASAFERGLERKYEMTMISRTTSYYPEPRQYFHSEFKKTTNNNAIFGFANEEVDKLVDVYRWDMDPEKRLAAMHRIDEIVNDEAFYIPLWEGPYMRFVYWDYVQFPKSFFPKRTEQYTDWFVYWIDEDKRAALQAAMKEGRSLGEDTVVDVDPWNVMKQ